MKKLLRLILCLSSLVPLATAYGQPFVNGSFEDPAVVGTSVYSQGTGPTGWTVNSGNMVLTNTGTGSYGTAQSGSQLFDLPGSTGIVGSTTQGSFSQTVSGLSAGQLYRVSYYVSSYATGDVTNAGGMVVTPGNNGTYEVSADLSGVADALSDFQGSNVPPAAMGSSIVQGYGSTASSWIAQSFTFRAGGGNPSYLLQFTLSQRSASGFGALPGVDNVMVLAVPEPSPWAAVALGMVGLAAGSWRARRRAAGRG